MSCKVTVTPDQPVVWEKQLGQQAGGTLSRELKGTAVDITGAEAA